MLLVFSVHADENEGRVALIAAKGSDINIMRLMEVRRLYLGYESETGSSVKNPVLNVQSKKLYDGFLKNVMHMTDGSYRRKLVKRIFRQGSEKIREIETLEELNTHLVKNVGDITFVEVSSIEEMEDVEVIQILW